MGGQPKFSPQIPPPPHPIWAEPRPGKNVPLGREKTIEKGPRSRRDSPKEEKPDPPFEILEPAECRGPVVFNSPHSGRIYPRAFLTAAKLDLSTLRRSEDSFVDELIAGVVPRGHPLMQVYFPRCYIDVNREPYELDPRMFEGRLPSFANTRSMRVAGGLGTVARVVGDAQEIYNQRIPIDDALR